MSNKVRVPYGDNRSETATLLLAAAEESKDFGVDDVQVSSYGGFLVPEEVAKGAGLDYEDEGVAMGHVYSDQQVTEAEKESVETPEPEAPKKTTAKKAASRKGGE